MGFIQTLKHRWVIANSLICVGIDPDPAKIPEHLPKDPESIYIFCREIIDATADYVCCFKLQIAHFAALGAESVLQQLIAYIHTNYPDIPTILDAKRGDVKSTSAYYAAEIFDRYNADAITVNPYLGQDALQPFLDYKDRGVIILCRTSNQGAHDIQDLPVDGRPLYQHIAEMVAKKWNLHGNCGLVVGATWPQQLREVRDIVADIPLLVPGIGAQGGNIAAAVQNGRTSDGTGLLISSSRAILYASGSSNYAQAAARAALALRDEVNHHRHFDVISE